MSSERQRIVDEMKKFRPEKLKGLGARFAILQEMGHILAVVPESQHRVKLMEELWKMYESLSIDVPTKENT